MAVEAEAAAAAEAKAEAEAKVKTEAKAAAEAQAEAKAAAEAQAVRCQKKRGHACPHNIDQRCVNGRLLLCAVLYVMRVWKKKRRIELPPQVALGPRELDDSRGRFPLVYPRLSPRAPALPTSPRRTRV